MVLNLTQERASIKEAIHTYFILHPEKDLCVAATEIGSSSSHILGTIVLIAEKFGWTEGLKRKFEENKRFYGVEEVRI